MEFELLSAAQYRAMDSDALNARRDAIAAEFENVDSAVKTEDLKAESKRCQDEYERRNAAAQIRSANIAAIAGGAGHVIERSANHAPNGALKASTAQVDPFDTAEYRNAFMEYIQRGTAIPMELRTGGTGAVSTGTTVTTGNAPEIPTTMGKEIVQKMAEYGDIWNKVRKISVQGGLWFRVLDIKPTATWLQKGSSKTELSTSAYQKVESDAMVQFSFYMLECRMAQSLLAQAVTFADFQALFVPAVAEAMVRALEQAIVRGDGTGQFLGITVDPRVTNIVEMTAAEFGDWQKWHSKVKKAMPKSYRNGEFIMAQSTWDEYIETMADNDKAPVSIGYNPVTGEEVLRLVGKSVTTVEPDILPDFATASAGEVVAIFGDLTNYVVNTQPGMPMTTKRWIDDETNTEKIKALMAADGKVLDPYGFILIKKKASA